MKPSLAAMLLVAGSVVVAAQTPPKPPPPKPTPQAASMDKAAVEKALIANERKINDAILKGDAATFKAMVATDGWGADQTGFMAAAEFATSIKPGIAKLSENKLDAFKVLWVDATTAVVTYTWSGKGTFMDQPVQSPAYCSSVYTKRGDKWIAVYHQETPAMAMATKK